MKIGCHISIHGGIENCSQRANELGCESFQVFTQNQRQWISKSYRDDEIKAYQAALFKFGYKNTDVISHASYLINLCASDSQKLKQSRKAFEEELIRCDKFGISGVVIHPGAYGENNEDWGIAIIAESLNEILDSYRPKVKILLETIAGQGTGIGYNFHQLQAIYKKIVDKQYIGFCLDTCHIFAAGYPICDEKEWDTVIAEIDETIDSENIEAIHLNDCKFECGSKKDRHAAIGEGFIGLEGFRSLINRNEFQDVPAILEVPGGDEVFKKNIKHLKAMRK